MASIRMLREECDDGRLPPTCMVCGEPANELDPIATKFSYVPPWIWITILAGLIVPIILGAILRKSKTVWMPLCEEHRGYWSNRAWMGFGLFLAFVGTIASMILLGTHDAPGWTFLATIAAFLFTLVAVVVVQHRSIRVTYIDDYEVRLTNVNADFREELMEQQRKEDEEYRERKRRRREEREYEERGDRE